jgi:hypothetical protein
MIFIDINIDAMNSYDHQDRDFVPHPNEINPSSVGGSRHTQVMSPIVWWCRVMAMARVGVGVQTNSSEVLRMDVVQEANECSQSTGDRRYFECERIEWMQIDGARENTLSAHSDRMTSSLQATAPGRHEKVRCRGQIGTTVAEGAQATKLTSDRGICNIRHVRWTIIQNSETSSCFLTRSWAQHLFI